MIDIHTHIIQNVDDGSQNLSNSIKMLQVEKQAGVSEIICTPHFRRSSYELSCEEILSEFETLKIEAGKIGIKLHLGQEISLYKNMTRDLEQGKRFSLAGSKYVLIEKFGNEFNDLSEFVYELSIRNYVAVIAHFERYESCTLLDAQKLVRDGAFLQINAGSLFAGIGDKCKKRARELLKNDLVSFVASDFHSTRNFQLDKAYKYVQKKYGEERAEKIFVKNPKTIIENGQL